MNKYNVRAIRKELEGYIRHSAWKKFRTRFRGLLLLDLQRAVVIDGKKQRKSLLHMLLVHTNVQSHPPVPIDLLHDVMQACPPQIFRTQPTPLSVALDRQARPAVVECLLMMFEQQSLYTTNRRGDTPLLQAVRQKASDEIVQMLVEYDRTKASLLIPCPKRKRVPLAVVIYQELSHCKVVDDAMLEECRYLLLQTYHALEIQQGKRDIPESGVWKMRNSDGDVVSDTDSFSVREDCDDAFQNDDFLVDVHAAIACAHFLEHKEAHAKLLSALLDRIEDGDDDSVDAHGDTVLHHLCRATHKFSLEKDSIVMEKWPRAIQTPNHQGFLPLHLAICACKPWEGVLEVLVQGGLGHIVTSTTGQLALHLALLNYLSQAEELHKLWMCFPGATAVLNGTERLYPFQLAAMRKCGPSEERSNNKFRGEKPESKAKESLDQLSDVFFFLRASPQVLASFR